jgi:hypothetical protein
MNAVASGARHARVTLGFRFSDDKVCFGGLLAELSQERPRLNAEHFGNFEKFDNVQPTLSRFVLRHIRLWLLQSLRNFGLRQVLLMSHMDQQFAKPPVAVRMLRTWHRAGRTESTRIQLIL